MITADKVKEMVNGQFSGYPWGGECFEVHQNRWGEWIANCHIWGYYGYSPSDPNWRFHAKGDPECPVRQFMVQIRHSPLFDDDYCILWKSENDMRKPTEKEWMCQEEPFAPPSPYIINPIKKHLASGQPWYEFDFKYET